MASTVLFAPQVRSVQPAFVYKNNKGTVKVYYTLSEFNSITPTKIRYKITDPNKTSSWGSDSMLIGDEFKEVSFSGSEYFEIALDGTNFKIFTLNQYYQVQIQLVNESNISAWSQVTLIRPVAEGVLEIDLENNSTISSLSRISGRVTYALDNSYTEAIDRFNITIKNNNIIVYNSGFIKNTLGLEFATELLDCNLEEEKSYTLTVDAYTINELHLTKDKTFTLSIGNYQTGTLNKWEAKNNNEKGGIDLIFKIVLPGEINSTDNLLFKLQRTDDKNNFNNWTTIHNFTDTPNKEFAFTDLLIETENIYKYRLLLEKAGVNKKFIFNQHGGKSLEVHSSIEDIYLLGEHSQLRVLYNPVITGFNYVTQENITNTLGGKFPIIRINGQTKYRQFSLSGTLSFFAEANLLNFNVGELDSTVHAKKYSMTMDEISSLLFDLEGFVKNFSSNMIGKIKSDASFFEKKFRDIAMEFLTDQKPKLFKGKEEDSMIVFLSNISFTPNKTLGREIYDFSCTVTEICEFTRENLKKYGLEKDKDKDYILCYVLKMMNDTDLNQDGVITSLDYYVPLEETIDQIPVLHAFWKEVVIGG